MAHYRKKPIVVWAEQFHAKDEWPPGPCQGYRNKDTGKWEVWIETLEGTLNVSDGDWIITGIKGESYPCKPDVFEATYELAEKEDDNG